MFHYIGYVFLLSWILQKTTRVALDMAIKNKKQHNKHKEQQQQDHIKNNNQHNKRVFTFLGRRTASKLRRRARDL